MASDVAELLLEAQVAFIVEQLTSDELEDLLANDVDDVLAIAGQLRLDDVVAADSVKSALRTVVDRAGGSALIEDLVVAFSDAIYDLAAAEDYNLAEVVGRDPVEALIAKVLSMQQLHDRAMRRMADSPLVATVAQRFVSKIVSDFVQQNRQMAERLPGAKSLFSLGASAASRVRNAPLIGEAADRGTQMAIKRTNSAMRDMLQDAPLQGAAMELWDMQAGEPISDLREYLSKKDLREIAQLVHQIIVEARSTDYVGELLDECVEVFFATYGERDLAGLLDEAGVSRDDLLDDLRRLVPPVLAAAEADGHLHDFIRDRLAPFYDSPQFRAALAGEAPTAKAATAKAPAKKAPAKKPPAKKAAAKAPAKKAAKKASAKK